MSKETPKTRLEYLRVRDIVRPFGILPVSKSQFYALVKAGKIRPGIALSRGVVVWSRDYIMDLVATSSDPAVQ